MQNTIHTKVDLKYWCQYSKGYKELSEVSKKYCISEAGSLLDNMEYKLKKELAKYNELIGKTVKYKGYAGKSNNSGTIQEVIGFAHVTPDVFLKIIYSNGGFDIALLSDLQ